MISEFIWLELIEKTIDGFICSCSLPAIGSHSDEDMIVCGEVSCIFNVNKDISTVKISIFDRFKELCVGECYQRKDFVQTVIFALNMKYGVNIQNAYIEISDCWGQYTGNLVSIDDVIRGVE